MTLRQWYEKNRKEWTTVSICAFLGISRMTLWRWMQGESTPSDVDVARITELTGGDVRLRDWFPSSAVADARFSYREADYER